VRTSVIAAIALAIWLRSFTFGAAAAEIPKGAHVLLSLDNSISTRTAAEGDNVYLRTASPISAGGRIIVPVGSYVQGVVARARRSGRVSGRAELAIRLETLTLASGRVVRIAPKVSAADDAGSDQKVVESGEGAVRQGSSKLRDTAQVAILAGSGASLGAMVGGITDSVGRGAGIGAGAGGAVGVATVLMTRGREVELRRGATLDVVFDRAVSLDQ
jgi:hypothetical protein